MNLCNRIARDIDSLTGLDESVGEAAIYLLTHSVLSETFLCHRSDLLKISLTENLFFATKG